jgi:hypothetical protein
MDIDQALEKANGFLLRMLLVIKEVPLKHINIRIILLKTLKKKYFILENQNHIIKITMKIIQV